MANRSIRLVRRKKVKKFSLFSDLPSDIIVNILIMLPIKTILAGKLVCREWRDIINSDPIFAETHYQTSRLSLLTPKSMFILEGYKKMINRKGDCYYKLQSSKLVNVGLGQSLVGFRVLNSCRGFLFLERYVSFSYDDIDHGGWYRHYSIYNPLTGEQVLIPKLNIINVCSRCCGLGFNSRTKQYKAVIFFHEPNSTYKILVYIICKKLPRNNAWKEVTLKEGYSNILDKMWDNTNKPLYLNGVLHWRAGGDRISSFDMDKEVLSLMTSPCARDSGKYVISIGEYRGLLCLGIKDLGNSTVEMWVMKDYGVNESWMKYVVVKEQFIQLRQTPKFNLNRPILVDVLDNGEIIFLYQSPSYRLLSYDPISRGFKNILLPRHGSKMWAEFYIPSFLSTKCF